MKKVYSDFDILVGDLKEYVRKNPSSKVIENDDVVRNSIKYEDEKANKILGDKYNRPS